MKKFYQSIFRKKKKLPPSLLQPQRRDLHECNDRSLGWLPSAGMPGFIVLFTCSIYGVRSLPLGEDRAEPHRREASGHSCIY